MKGQRQQLRLIMRRKLLLSDVSILSGTSYYLGTGWSTAITQFPIMPKLNVSNYYLHFVPQVAASTGFFNWLVPIMVIAAIIMLVAEVEKSSTLGTNRRATGNFLLHHHYVFPDSSPSTAH